MTAGVAARSNRFTPSRRRRAPGRGRATAWPPLGRRLASRWTVATALALLAVCLMFVEVLLTVEVQRVSLEAHELRKRLEVVSMEVGALESRWASVSSHVELDLKAAQLGLSVPEPGQVVILPASFLEETAGNRPSAAEELRQEYLSAWMRLAAMGAP